MIKADRYYLENLDDIMKNGFYDKNPRPKYVDGTPAHTKFIINTFEKYNINKGEFPITTLRNTAIKTGIKEILWIYQKQSNSLDIAHHLGINWWDEWDIGDGTIGQRYGATVRKYQMMDDLLNGLKNDPFSRRHLMNLYQNSDFDRTKGLFPCAFLTMWDVREVNDRYYLDLTLIQRSNDYIMSGYINKIQYVALLMMVAEHTGYQVGYFYHLTNNCHIYDRHFDAANEILSRTPLETQPKIVISPGKNFYDYTIDDFTITGIEGIQKIKSKLEIAI